MSNPPEQDNKSTAVCIVVENLPVPPDRRVWSEARALRDAGYLVSVICPKGEKSFTSAYEEIEGIHIYRHGTWSATSAWGYFLEYGYALLAELYLVLKVFSKTHFRVLQACNPPDTIFLIALLLKPFGVRFIFDHHDLAPELFEVKFGGKKKFFSGLTRLAEKCSFLVSNVSIATNQSFKDIAVARGGMSPDKVFVVRNCPDIANFKPGPLRSDIKQGKPLLVVYVGYMAQQDGLDLLLEAIEHLVKRLNRTDTHFLLIGGGTMLPELQAMSTRKGLDGFITFTGQVPHTEVVTYLSNADVGVAPDPKTPMNDNSTMIKIFEYMAFKLPVVLFDLKEGRLVAGPAALYAQPNDPVDFANVLSKVLDSSDLRHQLGEIGRKRIEESLNWDNEKKTLIRAYETALQS